MAVVGALTAILAGTVALVQPDIKRVLAYSTVSQLGYMFLAAGVKAYSIAVFFVLGLFTAGSGLFVNALVGTTMEVSLILAFFNMLPIWPLDGSKVLRWNKAVYAAVLVTIFALFMTVFPASDIVFSLVFMLVIAFAMSFLFRGGVRL